MRGVRKNGQSCGGCSFQRAGLPPGGTRPWNFRRDVRHLVRDTDLLQLGPKAHPRLLTGSGASWLKRLRLAGDNFLKARKRGRACLAGVAPPVARGARRRSLRRGARASDRETWASGGGQ